MYKYVLILLSFLIAIKFSAGNNFCQEVNPCGQQGDCFWLDAWSSYLCDCSNGEFTLNRSCSTPIQCLSNVCQNGGVCLISSILRFRCQCGPNFTGTLCETKIRNENPCEMGVELCRNNGTCELSANSTIGFECKCPPGFGGVSCEKRLSKCAMNCLHGRCINIEPIFYCDCDFGWTGDSCNISLIGQCDSNAEICRNGAGCRNIYNGIVPVDYECDCKTDFVGKNCDINKYEICSPTNQTNSCSNGGQCTLNNESKAYECSCSMPFTGKRCENVRTDLANECSTNVCKNGGKCYMYNNRVLCNCVNNFTGQYCESI